VGLPVVLSDLPLHNIATPFSKVWLEVEFNWTLQKVEHYVGANPLQAKPAHSGVVTQIAVSKLHAP
jgi:hypothetical protein